MIGAGIGVGTGPVGAEMDGAAVESAGSVAVVVGFAGNSAVDSAVQRS